MFLVWDSIHDSGKKKFCVCQVHVNGFLLYQFPHLSIQGRVHQPIFFIRLLPLSFISWSSSLLLPSCFSSRALTGFPIIHFCCRWFIDWLKWIVRPIAEKKPTFFWLRWLFEYEILCWKYSDDLWEISAASFCNFSLKRATSFVLSPCLIITLSCQTVQGSWHTYEWLGELLQARYVHPVRSLNSCICGLYQLAVLVVTLFSLLNESSSLSTATNL